MIQMYLPVESPCQGLCTTRHQREAWFVNEGSQSSANSCSPPAAALLYDVLPWCLPHALTVRVLFYPHKLREVAEGDRAREGGLQTVHSLAILHFLGLLPTTCPPHPHSSQMDHMKTFCPISSSLLPGKPSHPHPM